MNYIYDIVLNFQTNYYQFFEWYKTDKIKNISKIAVYRVNDEDLLTLITNDITLDECTFNTLKEENKRYKKTICLVSNTKQTIGILIDNNGKILKKSSLLFEEETEVNNFAKELPLTTIKYKTNNKKELTNNLRIEKEKKNTLINYISNTTDIITLKYLYYEYYKKECLQEKDLKSILLTTLEEEWTPTKNTLYQIIDILNKKSTTIK